MRWVRGIGSRYIDLFVLPSSNRLFKDEVVSHSLFEDVI
jgi:hypothetical protein